MVKKHIIGIKYQGQTDFQHGRQASMGVLVVNLGTPENATTSAVRCYLAEFLSDTRVVEIPRLLWKVILHGIILRIRPAKSARAYQKVWTEKGSPLMSGTAELAKGIKNLTVVCPGFSVDCIETLEEIAIEGKHEFITAGGEQFDYVPALNASAQHVSLMVERIINNAGAWPEIFAQTQADENNLLKSRQLAKDEGGN